VTFTARSETVITFHNFSFACWCSLPSLFLELWTHAFCIFWQSGAKFSLHSWDCPSMVHMVHMFRLFPFPPFAICIHLLFISILISWIFFIFLNHFEPFWAILSPWNVPGRATELDGHHIHGAAMTLRCPCRRVQLGMNSSYACEDATKAEKVPFLSN